MFGLSWARFCVGSLHRYLLTRFHQSLSDCLKIYDDLWRDVSLCRLHLRPCMPCECYKKKAQLFCLSPSSISVSHRHFIPPPLHFFVGCHFVRELPSIVERTWEPKIFSDSHPVMQTAVSRWFRPCRRSFALWRAVLWVCCVRRQQFEPWQRKPPSCLPTTLNSTVTERIVVECDNGELY